MCRSAPNPVKIAGSAFKSCTLPAFAGAKSKESLNPRSGPGIKARTHAACSSKQNTAGKLDLWEGLALLRRFTFMPGGEVCGWALRPIEGKFASAGKPCVLPLRGSGRWQGQRSAAQALPIWGYAPQPRDPARQRAELTRKAASIPESRDNSRGCTEIRKLRRGSRIGQSRTLLLHRPTA